MNEFKDTEEMKIFVARKLRELEAYDEQADKVEEHKALMESGAMQTEEFLVKVRSALSVNIETKPKLEAPDYTSSN